MNIKTTLKTSVAVAALFAVAAPVASPASAQDATLKSGNKNMLTVSGYVAKSLWYADDGVDDQLFITDGGTSETRVRWTAHGTVNEDVTAGALIEIEVALSNRNASATLGAAGTFGAGEVNADTTSNGFNDIRHQFVWVNHKKFGKLSLGNTDAAANGNTEMLLSGTTAIDLSSATPLGQGILFVNDSTAGAPVRQNISVGSVFSNFDFTSRTDVLRYDTPRFMGVRLSASLSGAGGGEVGARYSGKFGAFSVAAAVGYSELSSASASNDYNLGGSIAVLHDSGLNVSVAGSKIELDDSVAATTRRTPHMFYVSGGYKAKIFQIGGTNFNFHYQETRQNAARGDVGESIGITALQEFKPIGAVVGVFYSNYSLERKRATAGTGKESFEDIDVIGLTTVFNF